MAEQVFVAEHGHGARPAKVVKRYEYTERQTRVVVEFTDERGGSRDCFAASVHETREAAEAGSQ